jgi:hypothetical protein
MGGACRINGGEEECAYCATVFQLLLAVSKFTAVNTILC